MGSMPLFNNHHSEDLLDNKTAPRGFQYTQPWSPQEETADQILRGQQGEGWEAAVLLSALTLPTKILVMKLAPNQEVYYQFQDQMI